MTYGLFIQSQPTGTQSTSRPCVLQIWSRYPPESDPYITFVCKNPAALCLVLESFALQGYLAYKKTHPPRTLPYAYA